MKQDYINFIESTLKLKITSPELSSNAHQDIQCLICNGTFYATPKSKVANYRKHGTIGCPKCTQRFRYEESTKRNIKFLQEKFAFTVPNIWNNSLKLEVTNKKCGHTFKSRISNLLHINVNCPMCNANTKRQKFLDFNEKKYQNSLFYKKDFELYRSIVDNETKKTYRKYKNVINPNNYKRVLAKKGNVGYHLDHIASKLYCFNHNIPPELCADKRNLRMIPWKDNVVKHSIVNEEELPEFIGEYLNERQKKLS
jgi:uncharacterized Zn finger protein (UPF0148 family)